MAICIDWLVELCLKYRLISQRQVPWLRYGIEKRLSTAIGLIPFILIATLLTDLLTAICFLGGFYCLRTRTNGYHAKTILGCLLISLGTELVFLLVLYPFITITTAMILSGIGFLILLVAAPYNHPNMHFTKDEIAGLKVCVRHRVVLLACLLLIFGYLQVENVVKGLSAGIAMAAFMLCMAYITERRKTNE